jgi:NAD(P)-dependent dehydrogenase (short-subunit alcohol dehydrogenase family)
MRLKDKVILVTGGGGGLGQAICLRCAEEGSAVIVADINLVGAQNTVSDIEKSGGKALAVQVDVKNKAQVQGMVDSAVKIMGRVDVLVNNAGIFSRGPSIEISEGDWDRMMDINVKGPFLCSQAVLKHMVEKKVPGALIHMSSISGFVGFAESLAYCTAKGALLQMSKVLALEYGPHGIRSNVIAPGTFNTAMNDWFLKDEEFRKGSLASIPLGRLGEPEEIASTVVFLASDEASYFNGAEFLHDGGQITHI